MTRDTRIALFLMGVLVTALRDNGPNPIKRSMFGGVHDQGGMWWRNYCWIAPFVPDRGKQDSLRVCWQPLHIGLRSMLYQARRRS